MAVRALNHFGKSFFELLAVCLCLLGPLPYGFYPGFLFSYGLGLTLFLGLDPSLGFNPLFCSFLFFGLDFGIHFSDFSLLFSLFFLKFSLKGNSLGLSFFLLSLNLSLLLSDNSGLFFPSFSSLAFGLFLLGLDFFLVDKTLCLNSLSLCFGLGPLGNHLPFPFLGLFPQPFILFTDSFAFLSLGFLLGDPLFFGFLLGLESQP